MRGWKKNFVLYIRDFTYYGYLGRNVGKGCLRFLGKVVVGYGVMGVEGGRR